MKLLVSFLYTVFIKFIYDYVKTFLYCSSDIFNLVTFSPLIKNKRMDSSYIDNYRVIVLNSCLSKLLGYVFSDFFKVNLQLSSH